MDWLTRPAPHRLVIILSLILTVTVVLPELASGKHRRPKYRISTAGLVAGFGDPSFAIPPARFDCTWREEQPVHDYMCTPSPTSIVVETWPDPFPLKHALWRAGDTPLGEGWVGLASPEIAPQFSCARDGVVPLAELARHYSCTYRDPQLHTFTVADIVSVCDDELAVCADDQPATDPPPWRHDTDGFFVTDGWYLPDTMPPDTTMTAGPSGTVASRDALLGFSSSEDGSSFECRLDGGEWDECDAPQPVEELEDGAHSFEVRATDGAANLDPTPAPWTWEVDATPPETRLLRGPREITRDRTPSFSFTASEPTATFDCRLDAGPFTRCSSPHTVKPRLADGSYRFRVRASDLLGNSDTSNARSAFIVDTAGPRIRISGRSVRLTRTGLARVRVRCPRAELSGLCAGKLTLKSAQRVRLGRKRFSVRRGRRLVVGVKLSSRARSLVARSQSVRVSATARVTDRVGNAATTTRRFVLEAPEH